MRSRPIDLAVLWPDVVHLFVCEQSFLSRQCHEVELILIADVMQDNSAIKSPLSTVYRLLYTDHSICSMYSLLVSSIL